MTSHTTGLVSGAQYCCVACEAHECHQGMPRREDVCDGCQLGLASRAHFSDFEDAHEQVQGHGCPGKLSKHCEEQGCFVRW